MEPIFTKSTEKGFPSLDFIFLTYILDDRRRALPLPEQETVLIINNGVGETMRKIQSYVFALFISCFVIAEAAAGDAAEVLVKFNSFFNPGTSENLEEFRSCFPPEQRASISGVPPKSQCEKYPVGRIQILKEEYENDDTCIVVYRLEKRDGLFLQGLKKYDGKWCLNSKVAKEKMDQLLLEYVQKPSKSERR